MILSSAAGLELYVTAVHTQRGSYKATLDCRLKRSCLDSADALLHAGQNRCHGRCTTASYCGVCLIDCLPSVICQVALAWQTLDSLQSVVMEFLRRLESAKTPVYAFRPAAQHRSNETLKKPVTHSPSPCTSLRTVSTITITTGIWHFVFNTQLPLFLPPANSRPQQQSTPHQQEKMHRPVSGGLATVKWWTTMLIPPMAYNALGPCRTDLAAQGTPVTPTASGIQASPTWLWLPHSPLPWLMHCRLLPCPCP